MNTKERVASLMEQANGEYISGNTIAQELGITRAAVWKGIKQLEEEGYSIEAVRNRGYRLGNRNDIVSAESINRYLGEEAQTFRVETFSSITSTNDYLKGKAQEYSNWRTVAANRQTRGKGRRARSFYSPADSGLYLSMLVKLPIPAVEATRITTAAAVAACRSIEKCSGAHPQIKWVNDVYLNGKKVCGILTEASLSMESGSLEWAVMGIGFNVYEPQGGFPEEIAGIAGAICPDRSRDLRSRLAAEFMLSFHDICQNLLSPILVQEYKDRSMMKGRKIFVLKGEMSIPAVVEDIDEEMRLLVRYEDGVSEALSSGEVSIRV